MRKVALVVGRQGRFSREVAHRSLAEGTARGWLLRECPPEPAAIRALIDWAPDGLIAVPMHEDELAAIRSLGRPCVLVGHNVPGDEPRIDVDERSVADAALTALRGYSRLAFVGDPGRPYARMRRDHFVARAGRPVAEFVGTPDSRLVGWLERLPSDTGIFASNDHFAALVRQSIATIGRDVPGELGLVGVDDDNGESVDSVVLPLKAIALEACNELDRRFRGHAPRSRNLSPLGVAKRGSVRTADDFLLLATAVVRERAGSPAFGVGDLADALGFSRRTLEWRLRRRQVSPLELLRRERAERAAKLLEEGVGPLRVVAERSGFGSENALRAAFRIRFGTSPVEWARRCAEGDWPPR